jgi:hypothetical protein
MVLSRRRLFVIGGSALVAVSNNAIQGSQGDTGQSRTASLTRADFEAVINSSFELRSASGDRNYLVLASIKDLSGTPTGPEPNFVVRPPRQRVPSPRTEAFALKFFGTGPKLPQATYSVTHGTLGTFELFVVPSGDSSYMAVFNRLVGRTGRV